LVVVGRRLLSVDGRAGKKAGCKQNGEP